MSEKDTISLHESAINGVESYKAGYRHGLQEGEADLGLARLTIQQLRNRLENQDEHIERLEATILRCKLPKPDTDLITDPNAKGFRPGACDGGGPGSPCCDFGGCAADLELAEMRDGR